MRLICTITREALDAHTVHPLAFSAYLKKEGIANECEEIPSPMGGPPSQYRIWIHDEDQVEKASQLYQEYQKNPHDPRFVLTKKSVETEEEHPHERAPTTAVVVKKNRLLSPAPYGPLSILMLILVIGIYFWSKSQPHDFAPHHIPGVIDAPILAPLEKALIYDYPAYFQLRDELYKIYTPQEIEKKEPPSKEALLLIQKMQKTPLWIGLYDRVTHYLLKQAPTIFYPSPLFEKISSGEIWRTFTPALLHYNFLHIFFNVLWFIMLGNQIEFRIKAWKYLILLVLVGIFSNTAQYLMSGPFFMGLSGIVCGQAAFIWARQTVAPWEGYLLQRATLVFLALFVVGMFFLQLGFFVVQITGKMNPTFGIANTAHLSGALMGYLLGRSRFFSLHPLRRIKHVS